MALWEDSRLDLSFVGWSQSSGSDGVGVCLPLRVLHTVHMGQVQARMACHAHQAEQRSMPDAVSKSDRAGDPHLAAARHQSGIMSHPAWLALGWPPAFPHVDPHVPMCLASSQQTYATKRRQLCLLQAERHWSKVFTDKLSKDVKLVGSTISCEGSHAGGDPDKELRQNPHVQSYAVATDQVSCMCGHTAMSHSLCQGPHFCAAFEHHRAFGGARRIAGGITCSCACLLPGYKLASAGTGHLQTGCIGGVHDT